MFSFIDPRTTDWPLMSSPIPTIIMVLTYLYVVLLLGPWLMANRKPFKLKNVLIFYNGAQVLASLYMFSEVSMLKQQMWHSPSRNQVQYSHYRTCYTVEEFPAN